MKTTNRQILLARRPSGRATWDDFERRETQLPALSAGELRVRTTWLSVDPTNRIWMSDIPQYLPPVQPGELMRALGVGVVEESLHSDYQAGEHVTGLLGWQEHATGTPEAFALNKVPAGVPPRAMLGELGVTGGLTAYFGLLDVARPQAGETVVVTSAAGSVGSLVGQIAKNQGARVVGVAGGPEKCAYLVDELGFDAAVDYKAGDLDAALGRACPDGIDVDFENVGGPVLEAILGRLNLYSRIAVCGLISQYESEAPVAEPALLPLVLMRRVRVQGFIILDYIPRFSEAVPVLARWMAEGKLKYRYHEVEGLDRAVEAVNMLFDGKNQGKLLLRVS